jgi:hypothetical protein
MIKKRASQIFGEVDPKLKVVNGNVRRNSPKSPVMTEGDWDKAGGMFCSQCKREVVRLINGVCPQCNGDNEKRLAEKIEDRSERKYYQDQLRKGTIKISDMRAGRLGEK